MEDILTTPDKKELLLSSYDLFNNHLLNYSKTVENLWWETDDDFKLVRRKYSLKEKIINEKKINHFLEDLYDTLYKCPTTEEERLIWKDALWLKVKEFGSQIGFLDDEISSDFSDNILPITNSFITDAKNFDEDIKMSEILQALRNVWIINLLQWIYGLGIHYSKSIFSYSMLYPYTDNFLDDISISKNQKHHINSELLKILKGEIVNTSDSYIYGFNQLITMINLEFPRKTFPDLHNSLIGIHLAQCTAATSQNGKFGPYIKNVLSSSIEKGGTSVLADGYIIYGQISNEMSLFAYGYGALLQFCDDLQDALTDFSENSMTVFSQSIGKWDLDLLTNKLFNFIDVILSYNNSFISDIKINPFIKKNIEFLILEAISQNKKYYSKNYIKKISPYFPFRMTYMKQLYKKIQKRYDKFETQNGESLEDVFVNMK